MNSENCKECNNGVCIGNDIWSCGLFRKYSEDNDIEEGDKDNETS